MSTNHGSRRNEFQEFVGIRFQLYNSLFLSLPFYGVDKTGILLSLFNEQCEVGYSGGKGPVQIVDGFLSQYSDETIDLLFKFVQYVERQVVLFDALVSEQILSLIPEGTPSLSVGKRAGSFLLIRSTNSLKSIIGMRPVSTNSR